MKMYRLLFSSLFLFISFSQLSAQRPGGRNADPVQMAEQQTSAMVDSLALSEAQALKVGEVNLKYAEKFKKMRDDMEGDYSQMRETMMKVRAEREAELKTYLTEEQFTRWQTIEKERRSRRGQGNRPNRDKEKKKKKPNHSNSNG
jgi:hypothetical protein